MLYHIKTKEPPIHTAHAQPNHLNIFHTNIVHFDNEINKRMYFKNSIQKTYALQKFYMVLVLLHTKFEIKYKW
jgi:hypothetical protein